MALLEQDCETEEQYHWNHFQNNKNEQYTISEVNDRVLKSLRGTG